MLCRPCRPSSISPLLEGAFPVGTRSSAAPAKARLQHSKKSLVAPVDAEDLVRTRDLPVERAATGMGREPACLSASVTTDEATALWACMHSNTASSHFDSLASVDARSNHATPSQTNMCATSLAGANQC